MSQSRSRAARGRHAHRRPRAHPAGAVLVPTAAVAAVTGIVTAAYAVVTPGSGHGNSTASSAHHAMAMLEQQRQQMIAMAEASHSLNVVSSPKLATAQRPVHHPSPAPSPSDTGSSSSSAPSAPSVAPVDPGSAQSIAFNMLSQFGWNPDTEFACLDNIWSRESGWSVTAENPSGAYGIPQALPGSKMASAGPDWQTDATTQIRWGLGYIQSIYGDPCNAWAHWQANGSY